MLQMHLKLLQKTIKTVIEATIDLIGYKIADEITKVSKTSLQNNSETITNETGQKTIGNQILL